MLRATCTSILQHCIAILQYWPQKNIRIGSNSSGHHTHVKIQAWNSWEKFSINYCSTSSHQTYAYSEAVKHGWYKMLLCWMPLTIVKPSQVYVHLVLNDWLEFSQLISHVLSVLRGFFSKYSRLSSLSKLSTYKTAKRLSVSMIMSCVTFVK